MRRPLRVEHPGAIYHVMCRSDARQRIFHEEADHQRLIDGLESTVNRFGWELFSYVLLPNHFHLFLRTPQPSLWRGMQYLASGYANWFAKKHRCPGHLLQGRFKSQLVDVAEWLSRQLTSCTLRELAAVFGLGHADSVRNLTRRVDRALPDSSKLRQDIAAIRHELLKNGT
jgi:REP element-mobilizing transposase RayT